MKCRSLLPGLLALFLLTVLLGGQARSADAHGGAGAEQLVNEPAGPYLLSVWTEPDPARAGERLHLTIALSLPGEDGSAGEAVLAADVTVTLSPEDGTGPPLMATATNENAANKIFYEADLEAPAGRYLAEVSVSGAKGEGEAAFTFTVAPAAGPNWPLWGGLVGLLVAGIILLVWRRRA